MPSSPPGNPDFSAVVAGIALGGTSYEALAVGNIAQTATSASCCQDYALVSSTSKQARVVLSVPHDGLTFASTTKDQLVTFAATGGGLDVALARHDSDNRNDLWVLRTDKRLARVTAVAAPVGAIYFPASSYSDWPTNNAGTTAKSQMAVGDLDCDGDVDAAFPATNNRVLVVLNNQTSFAAPFALNSGHDPIRVALADVDNNGSLDILSAGRTGKISVLTSLCGGSFDGADTYQFLGIGGNYPDARIAAGRFCPGHPNDIAVAFGAGGDVQVACGDGSGSFDGVVEPHGDTRPPPFVYDYSWDVAGSTVKELAFWSASGGDLVGLFSGSESFKLLEPASCQIESRTLPLLRPGSGVSTFELHSEALGGTSWTRIAAAGPLGLLVSH